MSHNVLQDPSFETGVGWLLDTDCDLPGASYNTVLGNVRTGLRSLRINSRRTTVGPVTTCGRAEQAVVGLVPGVRYLFGVFFKASGTFPSVVSEVSLFDGTQGVSVTWNTNSTAGAFTLKSGIYTHGSGDALFKIAQSSGTSNLLQSRYYDDAFITEATDADVANPEALALRALAAIYESPGAPATHAERLTALVESLGLSSTPLSLGLRADPSKPLIGH